MVTMPRTSCAAVLVVDDHPLIRDGIHRILADQPDLRFCGEADGMSQAVSLFRRSRPDVVTADISLKNGSGLELTRELVGIDPEVRVLICSMHDDFLYAERALRAGARGYINKSEPIDRLLAAMRRVLSGGIYLSQPMTERMLARSVGTRNGNGNNGDCADALFERLSNRELEVFEQIGHGRTTRQIAGNLFLSPKTVETYREHIKSKLNLKNATELTQQAVQWVLENH